MKLFESFKTKAFKAGSFSFATTLVLIGIIVAINILVSKIPAQYTQFDTTESSLFTLSDETKNLVGGLDQDINIYWTVAEGNENSSVEILLNQYKSLNSHIKITKVDTNVNPTMLQEYVTSPTDNSLVVAGPDRFRYVDNSEIFVYDYSNYYYDGSYDISFDGEGALTSAIEYVFMSELPKIYTLSGHGEYPLSQTYASSIQKQNIETEELSLITANQVPADADALFIYSPEKDISESERDIILDYLKKGGRMILITDAPYSETVSLTNLMSLVNYYGVSVIDGIVVEGNENRYAYNTPYYLLPNIGFHEITSPIANAGYYIMLPLAQGIRIDENLRETVSVTELLTTSTLSYIKPVDAQSLEKSSGDEEGSFPVSVAITENNEDDSLTQIVWVTSSSFLDDSVNQMVSGGNEDMLLNSLAWMCEEPESSLTIHAKSLSNEYLTIPNGTSALLILFMIGVLPLGYVIFGIVTVVRRRRK